MKPAISIIVPVYNAEQYLQRTIASILMQTFSDTEIIFVDDGSEDRSQEIIEQYAKKDSRIILLQQEHQNAGAARNKGLSIARGEYLSFLDADDFFEPGMLETAYQTAVEENSDIVVFSTDEYIEETGEYLPLKDGIRHDIIPSKQPFAGTDIKRDAFCAFVGWPWDKLFRREFVQKNHLLFQEQRTTNDAYFVFMAIIKAERISIVDQVLIHHNKGNNSLSTTREKSWACFHYALEAMKEQLKAWGLYERFSQDYINYALHFSLWNVNTLRGKTFPLLYNKLKEEWFADYGVSNQSEEFWYIPYEYYNYLKIKELDADEYQYDRFVQAWTQLSSYQKELRNEQAENRKLNQVIQDNAEEISDLSNTIDKLKSDLQRQIRNYEQLYNSRSYKAGKTVTFIPRIIQRGLRCLRKHGLRYTLQKAIYSFKEGKEKSE